MKIVALFLLIFFAAILGLAAGTIVLQLSFPEFTTEVFSKFSFEEWLCWFLMKSGIVLIIAVPLYLAVSFTMKFFSGKSLDESGVCTWK